MNDFTDSAQLKFSGAGLAALNARVHDDLARTAHPAADWVIGHRNKQGAPVLDVVIVGAGQGGLAIAHALRRQRVHKLLLIDKAKAGAEGVWAQYARMPTLRSPKEFTGPDLGMPSLTYQSWHEALFGAASWNALERIPTGHWHHYLQWFRAVLGLTVHNQTELRSIIPIDGNRLALQLSTPTGEQLVQTRKLVLATGQDGTGRWAVPPAFASLPRSHCAATNEEIDFDALSGRDIAVIGQCASASDNAACALEAGAGSVRMLVRREHLQRIQPYLWMTFDGFLRHIGDMPDEWRWRFLNHALSLRESVPQATYDRMRRHARFGIECNTEVLSASMQGTKVLLETTQGSRLVDFVILGTGIEIDFGARPELAGFADRIATWGDRYTPPQAEANPHLEKFAYHAPDASFTEKQAGTAPYLSLIHDFTIGTSMSFGPFGCSINAMNIAVPRLVNGLTRGLFRQDIEQYWHAFEAYKDTVFEPADPDDL